MTGHSKKYRLSGGARVRQEKFGLLFYTMEGPRLFFLRVGLLVAPEFFDSNMSLPEWIRANNHLARFNETMVRKVENCLDRLIDKGVLYGE